MFNKKQARLRRARKTRAKIAELEKAGRLAGIQQQNAEQKYDENQVAKTQADNVAKELNAGTDKGDQTKEERKREILERFKDKARSDRQNDRGRGR